MSLRKKLLFALLTTFAFFAAVEGLLALYGVRPLAAEREPYVGFAGSIPLFVEQAGEDGRIRMVTAPSKLAFFNHQQFLRDKPEGTYRVFCMGGSTTFGHPYDDRTSFAAWLRGLLAEAGASRRWEVINAGGVSYASYRVAALMEELAAYEPDLFIVYTGHNEFLEERSYGELMRRPDWLRRTAAAASRFRTYTLMQRVLQRDGSPRRTVLQPEVDATLDHTVGPATYHRNDALQSQILQHFEFNLRRMATIARECGADLLLANPAVNLKDCSPFKSEHRDAWTAADEAAWLALHQQGDAAARQEDWEAAKAAYEQALAIDHRYAETHYRLGLALHHLGEHDAARASFERAVDEDVCPLRSLTAMHAIIERVARQQRVPLIDLNSIVKADCEYRYAHLSPGEEYFLDHVHLTIGTHGLLARGVVEALVQAGVVVPEPSWGEIAIASVQQRIESRVDAELQATALRNLAVVLSWAGKKHEAGVLALKAVELRQEMDLPGDPKSLFLAAVHHAMSGDNEQAILDLSRLIEAQPKHFEARWRLGQLLYDERRDEQALEHFLAAARLAPEDVYVQEMVGKLRVRLGRESTVE